MVGAVDVEFKFQNMDSGVACSITILTGTAQSLKTSFQSRKKTQTVFFSPDPCMDVLIVR